jgi:hypothetical protein
MNWLLQKQNYNRNDFSKGLELEKILHYDTVIINTNIIQFSYTLIFICFFLAFFNFSLFFFFFLFFLFFFFFFFCFFLFR